MTLLLITVYMVHRFSILSLKHFENDTSVEYRVTNHLENYASLLNSKYARHLENDTSLVENNKHPRFL